MRATPRRVQRTYFRTDRTPGSFYRDGDERKIFALEATVLSREYDGISDQHSASLAGCEQLVRPNTQLRLMTSEAAQGEPTPTTHIFQMAYRMPSPKRALTCRFHVMLTLTCLYQTNAGWMVCWRLVHTWFGLGLKRTADPHPSDVNSGIVLGI